MNDLLAKDHLTFKTTLKMNISHFHTNEPVTNDDTSFKTVVPGQKTTVLKIRVNELLTND